MTLLCAQLSPDLHRGFPFTPLQQQAAAAAAAASSSSSSSSNGSIAMRPTPEVGFNDADV
jgi:hypothetical protein